MVSKFVYASFSMVNVQNYRSSKKYPFWSILQYGDVKSSHSFFSAVPIANNVLVIEGIGQVVIKYRSIQVEHFKFVNNTAQLCITVLMILATIKVVTEFIKLDSIWNLGGRARSQRNSVLRLEIIS